MIRSSRSFLPLAAIGLALVAPSGAARADKLCVPHANGVPGKNEPPQWTQFDNPAVGNVDSAITDPRWLGASGHAIQSGSATAPLDFRTVYSQVGATQYLEMSWQVNVAAFGAAHVLYVGFMVPGQPSSTKMLRFHLPASDGSTTPNGQFLECDSLDGDCAAECTDGSATSPTCPKKQAWYAVYQYSLDCTATGGSNPCNCGWSSAGVTNAVQMIRNGTAPEWLGKHDTSVATTTTWLPSATYTVDTANRWTLRVRVPIDTSGGVFDMSKGVPPGAQFWYEAPLDILGTAGSSHQQWPRNDAVGSCFTGFDNGMIEMPGPLAFGDVALDPPTYYAGFSPVTDLPAGCAGVSVSSPDIKVIGPTGTPGNTIYGQVSGADFTNVFTATVHNDSSRQIDDQALQATFRIADWGSQVTPWGLEPDYPSGVWNNVPITGTTTTNPAVLSGAITAGATGQLSMSWKLSPDERTAYGLSGAGQIYDRHECVMVELASHASSGGTANIDFSQRSAFTNMELGSMSTFQQWAKISASPTYAGHDVYLVVMPKNMNSPLGNDGFQSLIDNMLREEETLAGEYGDFSYGGQMYGNFQGDESTKELPRYSPFLAHWLELAYIEQLRVQIVVKNNDKLRTSEAVVASLRQGVSFPTLSDILPSVDIYVYVDTGKSFSNKSGQAHHVLAPMSSFGYDLWHDGAVHQYKQLLDNAVQIAPNVYRVRTDANGNAIVQVVSQAVAPGETPVSQVPTVCGGGCCNPKCPTNVGLTEAAPPIFAGVFAFRRRKKKR
jgi:hypothetical protein